MKKTENSSENPKTKNTNQRKNPLDLHEIFFTDRGRLCRATYNDCNFIYMLRNHPETRKWMKNSEIIDIDEHNNWFREIMKNPNRNIFIYHEEDKKKGVVRVDKSSDGYYELSYMVCPEYRSNGIATKMVLAMKSLIPKLRAIIKIENTASIRVAEKSEMTVSRIKNGMIIYENIITASLNDQEAKEFTAQLPDYLDYETLRDPRERAIQ